MRKIGILTFHNVMNYGAVLQCYALQKVINKRYGNCAVIPYVNKQLAWNDKPVHLTPFNVKTIAKTVSQGLGNLKKRKAFDVFLSEYLQMGDTSNLANYTDIVVGSDQVWNVNLTNNDYTYFLEDYNRNKYAYAASFGEDDIPEDALKRIKEDVSRFAAVSVREQAAWQVLNKEKIESQVVIDPVLLLEEGEWKKTVTNSQAHKEKYILVYCVEKSKRVFDYARRLSDRTGLKIYYLNQNMFFKEKGFIYKRGVSPIEFLNYIQDAEYIVTNSFHGTAFSIIFEKKFAVDTIWHGEKNIRISNLLSMFELNDRDMNSLNENIGQEIDYTSVKVVLVEKRKLAQQFLDKCFVE